MRYGKAGKLLAIGLLLVAGGIHLLTARDQFNDATYKGLLFLANFAGAFVAAAVIWRDEAWGWYLGLLVTGGAMAAYLISRTVGLPGPPTDPAWFEPLGVVSVIAEVLFIARALTALGSGAAPSRRQHARAS